MTDTLRVHLNRESVHDVEPEASSFEATGSFALVLENHGAPTHAHVHLDDALASVATLAENNHYVEEGSNTVVNVDVGSFSGHVDGAVEIMTGYGSTGERVAVHLDSPEAAQVQVDETLGERPTVEEGMGERADTREMFGPTLLAAAGVLLAVLAMLFVSDTAAIFIGVAALLAGVGAAAYLLLQE